MSRQRTHSAILATLILVAPTLLLIPPASAEDPADEFAIRTWGEDTFGGGPGGRCFDTEIVSPVPFADTRALSCSHGEATVQAVSRPGLVLGSVAGTFDNPTQFLRWFAATTQPRSTTWVRFSLPPGDYDIGVTVDVDVQNAANIQVHGVGAVLRASATDGVLHTPPHRYTSDGEPFVRPVHLLLEVGAGDAGFEETLIPFENHARLELRGLHITPVNGAPDGPYEVASLHTSTIRGNVAVREEMAFTTLEDAPLSGQLPATDELGAPLAWGSVVSTSAGGTFALAPDGSFTFQPTPDFHGPFVFNVSATGGVEGARVHRGRIDVAPVNDPPTAVAAGPDVVTVPDALVLDGSASFDADGAGDIVAHEWLGVGSGPTLSEPTSLADLGFRTYRLRVTDAAGATSEADTAPVYVNARPVAQIAGPSVATVGAALPLDGSGSFDPNADGAVVAHQWSIEGVAAGSGVSLAPTFASFGWRNATLTVTDDHGTTGAASHAFYVNAPPVARATHTSTTLDGRGSSDPDVAKDRIVSYAWSFGVTGADPSFEFPRGRDACGHLTVMDAFGATDVTDQPLCLPEAEARARSVHSTAATTGGLARDTLGASASPSSAEAIDITWQGTRLRSHATARVDASPQDALRIEGLRIDAVATWDRTSGATTIDVTRDGGYLRLLGSPFAVPLPSEPAIVPLAGGGRIEMWQGETTVTDAGITHREDAMRVFDATGALVASYGSVLVQAGDHTLEAPDP